MARTTDLALVFAIDNDKGERYQLNSLQFADATAMPEPSTLALLNLGLAGLAFARRRQQQPLA